ncbi:MAG: hypothetical protein ABIH71_04785 [Candidatus Omnitrophota bacterium]
MDDKLYQVKQQKQEELYESLCKRCGTCCGAYDGDPCENLLQDAENKYFCRSYDRRLGIQKTVSGKSFTCVLIRDKLKKFKSLCLNCAYYI